MDTCGRDTCTQPRTLTLTGGGFWGLPMGRLHMWCCATHESDMLDTLRGAFGVDARDRAAKDRGQVRELVVEPVDH